MKHTTKTPHEPTSTPRIDTAAGDENGIVELVTVLVAVTNHQARVLTVKEDTQLPSGSLSPIHHSLQAGVRDWVKRQTAQPMGYVEQLYTFVDTQRKNEHGLPVLYVSYLGLVNEASDATLMQNARWQDWYTYFPWEDMRSSAGADARLAILEALNHWATQGDVQTQQARKQRIALCWGLAPYTWSEDLVLLRYELLYETGLIIESLEPVETFEFRYTGKAMQCNHRRVLATALARLRAKIKYRPVIFELMPPQFTLLQLQKSIESLIGNKLHKQNFRRQIHQQNLLEPYIGASQVSSERGRPAQLYQFKEDVLLERSLSSTRLPVSK